MTELIFGLSWTGFVILILFIFFCGGPDSILTVNGVPMTVREALQEPAIYIFFGIFIFIGFAFLSVGFRKVIRNALTKKYGYNTYGKVLDVYFSGMKINHRKIYNADVLVVREDGTTECFTERVGTLRKYRPGAYVKIMQYKNDINILESLEEINIPYSIKYRLDTENANDSETTLTDFKEEDTIIINGVTYKRQDDEIPN